MADPSAIVPYINDPYNEEEEEEEEEDIQVNFMDDSNPTLADLSMPMPMPMHERNFDDAHALMANANHLFQQDPFLWKWNPGTPQTRSNSGAGAGPSNGNVNVEPTPTDPFYLNLNMEMRPLSTWPVSPIPFNCTYCHVLREIIFTNGILLFSSLLFFSFNITIPIFIFIFLYVLSVILENFINFISCS